MKFDVYNCPDDWVELNKHLLHSMLHFAASKAGSINSLARKIEVPSYRLRKFTCLHSRRTNIALKDLRKVLLYLQQQGDRSWERRLRIIYLGRNGMIIKPKFPIDFCSLEGARVIADVLTDGALSLPRGTVEYMNSNEGEIINNIKSMNLLFCRHKIVANSTSEAIAKSKIKCQLYKYDTTSIGGKKPCFILKYPQTIGKFFLAVGLPPGRKVYKNPKIPEFILYSNRGLIRAFLERAIINEGYVKPTAISIGHSTANLDGQPPELLKGYVIMFNRLGIETSKPHIMKTYLTQKGHKRAYWRIVITGRNLDVVRDTFNLNTKQPSIKRRSFQSRWKPHQRIEQILNKLQEKRSISCSLLAASLGVSAGLISMYAKDLESTGKVRRRKVGVKVYYELVA